MKLLNQTLLVFVMCLVCGEPAVRAQGYSATINSVSSRTSEGLTFRISVPQHIYQPRQNIVIGYSVRNDSRKAVYLVLEPNTHPKINEDKNSVLVPSPVKYQEEWTRFDNTFVKLQPGQSYSGKLVIDGTEIPPHPKVATEDWYIQVAFGYVFNPNKADAEELLECVGTSYSFPCLGKLDELARVLTIGTLFVEVKSP